MLCNDYTNQWVPELCELAGISPDMLPEIREPGDIAGDVYKRQGIRELCDAEGICMIMDEVITGLRFRPGSAAGYYGVQPDITTFAKALAGGNSISLVGGKAKVMDICSPGGIVGVSGTYSGNQMAVYAANACVSMALEDGFYDHIEAFGSKLFTGMEDLMKKHGLPGHVSSLGARFAIYWGYEDREIDYDLRTSQKPVSYTHLT